MNQMSADKIQQALAAHFEWHRQTLIPNALFAGGEADLLIVHKSGFLSEVEIKCSLADWQCDQKKAKWASPDRNKIRRFWYAVPFYLVDKTPSWVPDSVGVISVSPQGFCTIWRQAKNMSKYKVTPEEELELVRKTYFRYWRLRIKLKEYTDPDRLG